MPIDLYDNAGPRNRCNLILIATEAPAVPSEQQIPINHTAETVKIFLEQSWPDIPTYMFEVENPLSYLALCGAFNNFPVEINYFFSFSHGWQNGLTLLHSNASPAANAEVEKALQETYEGPLLADLLSFRLGRDDFKEFAVHQMRISNLRYLSFSQKQSLQNTFRRSKGVFIAACNSAKGEAEGKLNFCQELANIIQKPVYGASFYSSFYKRKKGEKNWDKHNANRGSSYDSNFEVLLLPETRPSLLPDWSFFGGDPLNENNSGKSVLEIYRSVLRPIFPKTSLKAH